MERRKAARQPPTTAGPASDNLLPSHVNDPVFLNITTFFYEPPFQSTIDAICDVEEQGTVSFRLIYSTGVASPVDSSLFTLLYSFFSLCVSGENAVHTCGLGDEDIPLNHLLTTGF
ncbi:hypothetical protein ARMSODRAFT_220627 [Armillaria solidipes]|uniref:Uncharacterized protein n=1 Tax=Armillaria solidipes TaxID=1076256 RepID=A0A2H3CAL2_9AGAR|nr:hypothetical protein ARMSODRAFT_220627 [Armillaria solidipes]